MGDLGATVRNATGFSGFLIFSEAFDAGAQGHQRVVDVSGFTQTASGIAGSVETNDKINCKLTDDSVVRGDQSI